MPEKPKEKSFWKFLEWAMQWPSSGTIIAFIGMTLMCMIGALLFILIDHYPWLTLPPVCFVGLFFFIKWWIKLYHKWEVEVDKKLARKA